VPIEVRQLIGEMSLANSFWGAPRIPLLHNHRRQAEAAVFRVVYAEARVEVPQRMQAAVFRR
jgi:hypothetical protein